MRIGIDYRPVTAAPYSGIAKQVLAMEQALASSTHTLLRFTDCPHTHAHRQNCVCPAWETDAHGLHRPSARKRFESEFLGQALRAQQVDLYIATANMGLPWRAPRGLKQALLLHDVFQLTEHNKHQSRLKKHLYRFIDWFSIWFSVRRADVVLTPSTFSAKEIARLFPFARDKIQVLPNAVHFTPMQSPARASDLPPVYWLLVGTREPRKNIPWFIAQWLQARQQSASVPDLVLVGSAQDLPPEYRTLPGIHFKQQLSEDDLNALYYHAELLWQPSYAEGFGLPVIEALAQGTPVAVATGSALEEVAPPDCKRFSPVDGEALQALMHTLSRLQRRDAATRATLQQWANRFDHAHYQQRLLAAVQSLVESK